MVQRFVASSAKGNHIKKRTKLMDKLRAKLIEDSYIWVFAKKADLANQFYENLFKADPGTQALFRQEMYVQKEMFATMLATIVKCVSRPDQFEKVGARLALKHVGAGVGRRQYALAVQAMMAALRDVLKEKLTKDAELAWEEAIQELVSCMDPDKDR